MTSTVARTSHPEGVAPRRVFAFDKVSDRNSNHHASKRARELRERNERLRFDVLAVQNSERFGCNDHEIM